MSISLQQITSGILAQMQEILSRSAGYQVSIRDELDYFDAEAAAGWTLARDEENKDVGFIRSFKRGADWSNSEFYIDATYKNRRELALKLLAGFKEQSRLVSGHRIRFDIEKRDFEFNEAVEKLGFSQNKQEFYYFEIALPLIESQIAEVPTIANPMQAREVASVLSHLHPVDESEALKWIEDKSIRIVSAEQGIASVVQICDRGDSGEINRIATHSKFERKGYASALLKQLCSEIAAQGKTKLTLKVESIRLPAISFYKKFGFHEVESKAQIWHSSWN